MNAQRLAAPATFAGAYQQLRRAQKSAAGAPPYSLWVNRPLGRVLAAAAYPVGLTPNQVTTISAVVTFAAIALLATAAPSWPVGVAVSVGLVVGYALDSADGQLARLRGGGSLAGEWLDHMVDSAKNCALHLAVLVTAYRYFDLPDPRWLLVPLGFTVVSVVHFFGMLLNEQLVRGHALRSGLTAPTRPPTAPLVTLLKLPTDYGVLCLVFVLLGAPAVFSVGYALLALGSAGYLVLALGKWFRTVRALDASPPGGPVVHR